MAMATLSDYWIRENTPPSSIEEYEDELRFISKTTKDYLNARHGELVFGKRVYGPFLPGDLLRGGTYENFSDVERYLAVKQEDPLAKYCY